LALAKPGCEPVGVTVDEYIFQQGAVELNNSRHQAGPSSLVAGADACAIIAIKVFVEEDMVAPVGVGLEFLRAAKDRASP
jgi:hypothetical protein